MNTEDKYRYFKKVHRSIIFNSLYLNWINKARLCKQGGMRKGSAI